MTKRRNCPSTHYRWGVHCTMPAGHREIWHQAQHPDKGVLIRFRQAFGNRITQEWVTGDDGDSGEWVTLHLVEDGNRGTPTLVDDLDERVVSLLSGHVDITRYVPAQGIGHCSCGAWFTGEHRVHVASAVSVWMRSFFDTGRAVGAREAAHGAPVEEAGV